MSYFVMCCWSLSANILFRLFVLIAVSYYSWLSCRAIFVALWGQYYPGFIKFILKLSPFLFWNSHWSYLFLNDLVEPLWETIWAWGFPRFRFHKLLYFVCIICLVYISVLFCFLSLRNRKLDLSDSAVLIIMFMAHYYHWFHKAPLIYSLKVSLPFHPHIPSPSLLPHRRPF